MSRAERKRSRVEGGWRSILFGCSFYVLYYKKSLVYLGYYMKSIYSYAK